MLTYKITNTNTAEIYRSDSESPELPFLIMPTWPNGEPWSTKAEAESWATLFISSQEEGAELRPGDSPDEPEVYISRVVQIDSTETAATPELEVAPE